MTVRILIVMLLFAGSTASAAWYTSDNYAIERDVISGGGNRCTSANYALSGTCGQPGPVFASGSANYSIEHGFWHAQGAAPPAIADAGPDFYGYESRGATQKYICHLDGTGSVGALTYSWEQVADGGMPVTLRNAGTETPDFDAPMWDGSTELTRTEARLHFQLTINTGEAGEDSDEVEVYIRVPGDATGDDLVNAFDLAKLRQFDPSANFNGDVSVNAFDLAILRQNAGRVRTEE